MRALVAALLAIAPFSCFAQASSQSRSMDFDSCLGVIRKTSTDLGVAPINIVETTDMRIVRFPTADGSVLITCSRSDRSMVVTKSPK